VAIPNAVVSQEFGPRPSCLKPLMPVCHFHTGIDLAVRWGAVFAARWRRVARRADDGPEGDLVGYGNYVILQHGNGLRTLYAHLMIWRQTWDSVKGVS